MNNKIGINIWDDYHDDGYVPEGETQETFAYVESGSKDDEFCKHILTQLKEKIEELLPINHPVELSLEYYDSTKIYPQLVGTEDEYCLYKLWQINFKHLSHELREELMEKFERNPFIYNNASVNIYSES